MLVGLALVLSMLACGGGGAVTRRNNEIRRVAVAYELAARGPVDEVLVAFGLTEARANLGFEGGNTVWLNRLAEGEYLRARDTRRTYLFLHDLDYADGAVSLVVDRGDASGLQSRKLALAREDNGWQVVSDEILESVSPSPD